MTLGRRWRFKQRMHSFIGVDFGTTNSSIARVGPDHKVELAQFRFLGDLTPSFRSLLYMELQKDRGARLIQSWSGPEAIEHYLASENKGRILQSLKSFLSSRTLVSTDVFGRRRTLEELVSRILRDLREQAERQFGIPIRRALAGRPVRFVGAEKPQDDEHAVSRLEASFKLAGFEEIRFELEPVAAAHYYESTLDHDELILIGDFGGGTSDFSLVRAGPSVRRNRKRGKEDLLGNSGVGIAGDAFDAKIIRHVVSPALGAGTMMRSAGKVLPVPKWVYFNLERWHHLSFLRSKEVTDLLTSVKAQAHEPDKIEALLEVIREDLGYQLHRAVHAVKSQLSVQDSARFRFTDGTVDLDTRIERKDFEKWIAEEIARIEDCVDGLLRQVGASHRDIDMVFLTGGTSFVPAVRRIFELRFGTHRIRSGNEFTSVAWGLALQAASDSQF